MIKQFIKDILCAISHVRYWVEDGEVTTCTKCGAIFKTDIRLR